MGDSGGPAFLMENDRWVYNFPFADNMLLSFLRNTIIGITSIGLEPPPKTPQRTCYKGVYPDGFSKVAYTLTWIKKVLAFTKNITGGVEAIAHDSKCNEINL